MLRETFFAVEKKHFKKENNLLRKRNKYSYLDFEWQSWTKLKLDLN